MALPNPFGSVSRLARADIQRHIKVNAELRSRRYPLHLLALRTLLVGKTLQKLPVFYLSSVIILLYVYTQSKHSFLLPITNWLYSKYRFKDNALDVTGFLLTTQAALLGLVFPVILGLVTVLSGDRSSSNRDSEAQIYYAESLALEIGASCLALVIALVMQLFMITDHLFTILNLFVGINRNAVLNLIHGSWLLFNASALWYFIYTSLLMVRPEERSRITVRHSANQLIPEQLTERMMDWHYQRLITELDDQSEPMIYCGIGLSRTKPAVVRDFSSPSRLVDVHTRLLRLVITRWKRRSKLNSSSKRPSMVFPASFGTRIHGNYPLCVVEGGAKLTPLEQLIVYASFRFRRTPE